MISEVLERIIYFLEDLIDFLDGLQKRIERNE
jgi:hypothetical protein